MKDILEIQKKAFLDEGPPSLTKRIDLLKRCIALIETHEEKIIKALNHDFKNRSVEEIKISEIDQTIRNLLFTIRKLNKWMQPQRRFSSLGTDLLGAKSFLKPSPLGTVGIISPWNFPLLSVTEGNLLDCCSSFIPAWMISLLSSAEGKLWTY